MWFVGDNMDMGGHIIYLIYASSFYHLCMQETVVSDDDVDVLQYWYEIK